VLFLTVSIFVMWNVFCAGITTMFLSADCPRLARCYCVSSCDSFKSLKKLFLFGRSSLSECSDNNRGILFNIHKRIKCHARGHHARQSTDKPAQSKRAGVQGRKGVVSIV
jgi:hypothetical protein